MFNDSKTFTPEFKKIIIPKIGPFIPKIFIPIFNWKVDQVIPFDKLPTLIRITTLVKKYKFIIISHPYNNGEFSSEIKLIGFGGKNFWLYTKDPEEAIKNAEKLFIDWVDENWIFYDNFKKYISNKKIINQNFKKGDKFKK